MLFDNYQILMMLSLSSFLRLILACIVAAILHQPQTNEVENMNTKEISVT